MMFKTSEVDFNLVRGDSVLLRVELVDYYKKPFDPTAYTSARWCVAKTSKGVVLLQKDFADISYETQDDRWYVTIPIGSEDTQDWKPDSYYHELELRDAVGGVLTPFTGKMVLQRDLNTAP